MTPPHGGGVRMCYRKSGCGVCTMQTDFPSPPDPGLFTRFILENPWPVVAVLASAAFVALWIGLREGRRAPLKIAGLAALLAAAVFATASLVTTPAEHAERVTRNVVEAAVAGDIVQAMRHFTPDAALALGSPRNPGMSIRTFETRLIRLHEQYTITGNRTRTLRGYTEGPDAAIVHLACSTEVAGWSGATPTQWVLRVERQEDETWLVTRLTFVSIMGNTPDLSFW